MNNIIIIIKITELLSPSSEFKVLNKIGEGTFGKVFKVDNISSETLTAMKIINFKS